VPPRREVSLLWALRSPCNLGCTYCYFGTLEEHRGAAPTRPGQLSHLPHHDLPLADITQFLSTAADSGITRVFIAGGEPLIWPTIGIVLHTLQQAGIAVTVCTNGIPLNRAEIREMLRDAHVDAVSVSLDSANPQVNDAYRPARNRKDGWHSVVSGIRALTGDRGYGATMRIGVYTVISRHTLATLPATAAFAAELGADYFVPQPISLAPDHPLHPQLSLREQDIPAVTAALDDIYDSGLPLALPERRYPGQIVSTVRTHLQLIHGCFGGHRLAFIEPDGSVWDCPSQYRIADTADRGAQRSIRDATAAELFQAGPADGGCDCPFYSRDCVSMWPLMDFDHLLTTGAAR
jgi:MoaA/NifB/PqqE/SkfB family radical SAM enzyme